MSMFHLPTLGRANRNTAAEQANRNEQRQAPKAPLDPKVHNPDAHQHLDLRGKFDKDKQDVMLGRVQWALENQLHDASFKGNRKELEKRIGKLQDARDHLKQIPNDKDVSSSDIAVLQKALKKAASALPDSAQKRTITMLANYMAGQWGDAKRDQVASNVAKEQRFLGDDGAVQKQGHGVSAGVSAGVGAATIEARVGTGKTSSDAINHQGAHVHQVNKRHHAGAGVSANGIVAQASANAEAAKSKTKNESEAYAGGTQEYVKKKGYKNYFGSMRADAKAAKLQRAAQQLNPTKNDNNAQASTKTTHQKAQANQLQNAAQAMARPESRLARLAAGPMQMLGPKNDLRADAKVQQEVRNQESLLKAMLASEFGLDVEFSQHQVDQQHTKVQGRSFEVTGQAKAQVGTATSSGSLGANASASAQAKFVKTEDAYVKYEPMWQALKADSESTEAPSDITQQRKAAVLKKAQKVADNHPNLFQGAGKSIENASKEELLAALKQVEADIDNYTSHKKMLGRTGAKTGFSDLVKRDTKEIEKHYGAHSALGKNNKASEEVIKAATILHAALGAKLLEKSNTTPQDIALVDKVANKVQNPGISLNEDKMLKETHFASKSELNSNTVSSKFTLSYGVELPSIANGMPGLSKGKGVSVEVAKTNQTDHPDRFSRGESIDVTINLPPGASPETLQQVALGVAQKVGIPELAGDILNNLSNAVSIETDAEGKLSVAMKFSKASLDKGNSVEKDQEQGFQLEYAAARLAVRNKGIRAKLTPEAAGLPVSPQLGFNAKKTTIVPLATTYGEGSLKNIIRSFNTTHSAQANGQNESWQQQKALRQPAIDKILRSIGDGNNANGKMLNTLFDEAIANAPPEQTRDLQQQKADFFALAQAANKNGTNEADLAKLNEAFESLLSKQHETWLTDTSKAMQAQKY